MMSLSIFFSSSNWMSVLVFLPVDQAFDLAHSAGVKVFIDKACTSSFCILLPKVL